MNLFQKIKLSLLSRKLRTNVYSYYMYRLIYFFLDLFFLIPIVILSIIYNDHIITGEIRHKSNKSKRGRKR